MCYYLRIRETSSVVLGRKRTSLLPAHKETRYICNSGYKISAENMTWTQYRMLRPLT